MQGTIRDDQRVQHSCREALHEVLETMFFELPVDEPSCTPPAPTALAASAKFSGVLGRRRIDGEFHVAIEPPMLSRLAQDFLGLDELEPPDEGQSSSVLCELTNMLCGSTLSRLEPEAQLRIATPQTGPVRFAEDGLFLCPWIDTPLECGTLWVRLEAREVA